MRTIWEWLKYKSPIIVHTWKAHEAAVFNGFELGRDYEGAVREGKL